MFGRGRRVKGTRKKFDNMHTTQETTALKIELSAQAISRENARRRKHNESRAVLKGKVEELNMIRPSWGRVNLHNRPGRKVSIKYLRGTLSVLCDTLRWAGMSYPWSKEGEMV